MTGNVGRALLQNAEALAPVVMPQLRREIGVEILQSLANFYTALVCGWVIDPKEFGKFGLHVDNLLRTHLAWHPGVPAIHLGWNSLYKKLLNEVPFYLVKQGIAEHLF